MNHRMKEYAELLIRAGVNVQEGQTLFIYSPVDCADLARLCVERAYDAKAQEVVLVWSDDFVARQKYLRADGGVFDQMPEWLGAMYDYQCEISAPKLVISGSDPEALKGVDPNRIQRWEQASGKRAEKYWDAQMNNKFQWCIGAYATPSWAKKVFPQFSESEAVQKLWDAIYAAVRVEGDGGAIGRWEAFCEKGKRRIDILNNYNFKSLIYQNSLGTNLTIDLPEGHFWSGGAEKSAAGVSFIANIPTEEVFTAPQRDGVNGKVVASKPLVLSGNIVRDFYFELENGKIVRYDAASGKEFLKKALETDEGASYLGEVALVPYDSPISNSGILFYNTLFDENASCHFAFGEAYPCVYGAGEKSKDDQKALGLNQSFVHEDFMVGTPDLSITGITFDGQKIPVFIDGNFTF